MCWRDQSTTFYDSLNDFADVFTELEYISTVDAYTH